MAGAVAIAGPVRVRPEALSPYDPETRPWYLDQYWQFFQGAGFAVASTPTATTLAVEAVLGNQSVTVASATGYVTGQPIIIKSPAGSVGPYTWQVVVVTGAPAGNVLTVNPRIKTTFPLGSTVVPAWNNDTHPGTSDAYRALAQFVADAKRASCVGGTNLLGAIGAMAPVTLHTDALSEANVPVGWESSLPASVAFLSGVAGRSGNAGYFTGSSGILGAGMRTVANIPVVPGQALVASAAISQDAGNGGAVVLRLIDKATRLIATDGVTTSGSTAISTATGGLVAATHEGAHVIAKGIPLGARIARVVDANNAVLTATATLTATGVGFVIGRVLAEQEAGANNTAQTALTKGKLGIPTVARGLVPAGVTNVEVQIIQTSGVGNPTVSDVRLMYDRQDSSQDRYVLEDPGLQSIVVLGDSWTAGATGLATYLDEALESRFGRSVTVINSGISGNTLAQMIARFKADVLDHKPKYCVIQYGANDLTSVAANPQAAMEAAADQIIALCRSNGIIPVILGLPPITSQIATALARNDQVRARVDAQNGLVSSVW